MSFRTPCHMPFRKLIPPFILTEINLVLTESVNRNFNNCRTMKACRRYNVHSYENTLWHYRNPAKPVKPLKRST